MAEIHNEIDQIELQHGVSNVSLSRGDNDDDDDSSLDNINRIVTDSLIHVFDCSLVSDVTSDAKESIEAIQELVAAVASYRFAIASTLMGDRLLNLTKVLLERVRSASCRTLGWLIRCVRENGDLSKEHTEKLLDVASQALLPRFTDKAQSVRQAAIEASGFFFRQSERVADQDVDDPDIRQSLQWSLQHDPSVTNRAAALESLPVTMQTMDVILTRVRDVKQKVRVAAVKALREKLPAVQHWAAEQCAELVESGWTDR